MGNSELSFEEVCKPVVIYIQKHYGASHVKAIITCDYAELVKGQFGVPFKFEEQSKVAKDISA